MLKAYKYRLYPTEEQKVLADKHFGCSRFIYNWALDKKTQAYQTNKLRLDYFDLAKDLTKLKGQHTWLGEVYSQCLQSALRNLDNAFVSFFHKKNKFPRFKSKHNSRQSCQYPQGVKVNFTDNTIKFPKIGLVQAVLHRSFEGKIKTVTLSKTPTCKYFVSILVDNEELQPSKMDVTESTTTGIDLGLKHFVTLSNGAKVGNPHLLSQSEQRLKILQRKLSKKQKGSTSYRKARIALALKHERITNQRNDFLHKLSHQLVSENQVTMLVCEDLNVEGMLKTRYLAKAISDVAWSRFNTMISYKCDNFGKTYMQIGRFDSSSKICNECGYTNHELTLAIREWECPQCKAVHDRDINAAINIKKFGYLRFLGTGTEVKQSPSERSDISLEL